MSRTSFDRTAFYKELLMKRLRKMTDEDLQVYLDTMSRQRQLVFGVESPDIELHEQYLLTVIGCIRHVRDERAGRPWMPITEEERDECNCDFCQCGLSHDCDPEWI